MFFKNKVCLNCSEYKNCRDNFISYLFFIVGIISAIAIRLVPVLANLEYIYGQIAWYIGVLGFLMFFIYKFKVEKRRQRTIFKTNLISKLKEGKKLEEVEYKLLFDIICSITSNKDKINYFVIFITSAIAIIVALYFDFIKIISSTK